jgi:EAL domain-containing protein (putative c-di-GMP-specific phosphodiesterase class I)
MADPGATPPRDTEAIPVLCFTGTHARLPQLLAAIKRSGIALAARRCTTLLDFARELTRSDWGLVAVDCGPGNLRLAEAIGVFRRSGRATPVVILSEPTPEAQRATAGLEACHLASPDDPRGLADLLRRVGGGQVAPGSDVDEPVTDSGAGPAELADQDGLLAALGQTLDAGVGGGAVAVLAVVAIGPEPAAGEESRLGRWIGEALGGADRVAWLGGGRFAALLAAGDPALGVALAHSAREQLIGRLPAGPATAEQPSVAIGMSPPRATDGGQAAPWLARTLDACAVAARTDLGYAVLSPAPVAAPSARDVPGLLKEALVNDRLTLHFQPIVSLRGDARQHYEALVRLPSATAGELLPGDFLGPARASGLILAVDHWVIRAAIRRLARERATNRRIHLFVPLSAESVADGQVLVAICDALRDHQATGDWLTLQLRVPDVAAHRAKARALLDGLRQIRCRLALDRYDGEAPCRDILQAMPFDFVKLSSALTRDLHRDTTRLERVRGTVADLERRGVRSVATGVEDSQTLAYLWTVGVEYAQGFFLQEPSEGIAYDGRG